MKRQYKGFEMVKTGRQPWDWRCDFGGRSRWGTIAELQSDIDAVKSGAGLPNAQRGFA